MKITIERRWRKGSYTIGRLYLNSMQPLCNTLEPTDRGLSAALPYGDGKSGEFLRLSREVKAVKSCHAKDTTAIPAGTYPVRMQYSQRLKGMRPFLSCIPGFDGVMIHEGNDPKDTTGCILVGENTQRGRVMNSRHYMEAICQAVTEAQKREEVIRLIIK